MSSNRTRTQVPQVPAAAPGRRGKITRWKPEEAYGLITDTGNSTWFLSRNRLALPVEGLSLGMRVTFSGTLTPRPGKRYPDVSEILGVLP